MGGPQGRKPIGFDLIVSQQGKEEQVRAGVVRFGLVAMMSTEDVGMRSWTLTEKGARVIDECKEIPSCITSQAICHA